MLMEFFFIFSLGLAPYLCLVLCIRTSVKGA